MAKKSRSTRQKEALEKSLSSFGEFFDAEALHEKACAACKGIGIATTYRFLRERSRQGRVHQYTCEKKTIYSNSLLSHSHFTCKTCGKKTHFNLSSIDFISKKIPGKACHIQLDVHGTCVECLSRKK